MDILATVNREDGCTVVVSLHQVNVAVNYCARTIALSHGRIVYDGSSAALTPALLRQLYGADADEILALGDHIGSLQDARRPPAAKPWAQPLPQAA
jgi:phosphonate transport system ATP-binding protein